MNEIAAGNLRPLAAGIALYYCALAISHGLLLEPSTATAMVVIAGGTAALFFAFFLLGRSALLTDRAELTIVLMAVLVMGNSLLHLALLPEIKQTTNVALAMLGGGLLFYSGTWLAAYLMASLAGWWAVTSSWGPTPDWSHYAFMLVAAYVLATLTFVIRIRALTALEGMRVANREAELRAQAEQEKREMLAQVLHSQKLGSMGVLAGGIAHDFNNILGGMYLNVELAMQSLPPGSKASAYLNLVMEAGHRASTLTRQMLDYSAKGSPVSKAVRIQDLLGEAERLLRASTPSNIEFECRIGDEVPAVECDPSQFQQVILNLVMNAAEAIGAKTGRVTLRVDALDADRAFLSHAAVGGKAPEGRYVRVEVSDDGCGIDTKTAKQMFDPFFTTKSTERGLGLATISGIVRSCGGAILVDSTPGRGTCVAVLFRPSLEPPPAREAAVRPERRFRGTATILVADDEADVPRACREILEKAGFSVIDAENGIDALQCVRRPDDEIDLVLLDVTMPGMAGLQVLREIGDLRIKVILTSGYGDEMATGVAGNVVAYLRKPFTSADLLDTVVSALDR